MDMDAKSRASSMLLDVWGRLLELHAFACLFLLLFVQLKALLLTSAQPVCQLAVTYLTLFVNIFWSA